MYSSDGVHMRGDPESVTPPTDGGRAGVGEAVPSPEPSLPRPDLDEIVEEIIARIERTALVDYDLYPCGERVVTGRILVAEISGTTADELYDVLYDYGFRRISKDQRFVYEDYLDYESIYFRVPGDPYTLLEVTEVSGRVEIYAYKLFFIERWG